VATWLGLLSFAACFLMFLFGVGAYLRGTTVPGWTSLFVAVTFLGAVQLICVGLLGEYVGRIYAAVQGRPAYYVASDSGYPGSDAAEEVSPADAVGARLG
jgi:polyisoprenyl-phosphate glycosyltransferase